MAAGGCAGAGVTFAGAAAAFGATLAAGDLLFWGAMGEETVTGLEAAGVDTLTGAAFTGTLADTLEGGALTGAFEATLGLAFGTTLGAGLEADLVEVLATTGLELADLALTGLATGFFAASFCTGVLAFGAGFGTGLATTLPLTAGLGELTGFTEDLAALLAAGFTTGLPLAFATVAA